MINNLSKYSVLTIVITVVYVKFFLAAPFFHHHHHDENSNEHQQAAFHTHLFDSHTGNSNTTSGIIFDNPETEHSHFYQLNLQSFVFPQRTICINQIYITSSFQTFPDKVLLQIGIQNLEESPLNKYQQDKYVQSAANVSPPLA